MVRDDAFDCVTYCEIVLAAALARDYGEFEAALKKIRYANGDVRWDERNHYFAEWCRNAVDKKICRPIALPKSLTIDKAVNFGNLGRRQVSMQCVPSESLLAHAEPVGERRRHRLRVAADEPRFLPHRTGDAVSEG